jgi:hypothetical protein
MIEVCSSREVLWATRVTSTDIYIVKVKEDGTRMDGVMIENETSFICG